MQREWKVVESYKHFWKGCGGWVDASGHHMMIHNDPGCVFKFSWYAVHLRPRIIQSFSSSLHVLQTFSPLVEFILFQFLNSTEQLLLLESRQKQPSRVWTILWCLISEILLTTFPLLKCRQLRILRLFTVVWCRNIISTKCFHWSMMIDTQVSKHLWVRHLLHHICNISTICFH